MDVAPDGKTVFLAIGDVGGFAVPSVRDGGRDASVTSFVALPLSTGASVVDPHGLRVRAVAR
jgi:hypothetical protein